MAKNVLVLMRQAPFTSSKVSEGLRMSVGQTMAGQKVTALLLDAAALGALPTDSTEQSLPPLSKHIEMLGLLGHRVAVERESLARYGLDDAPLRGGIEVWDAADVARALAEADAVICY